LWVPPYSKRVWTTLIRREVLNKMILFSEAHVRNVVSNYVDYYNVDRPHQGMGNRRLTQPAQPPPKEGIVLCRQRLGGLLKSYFRQAA
jgi:putative transposase